MTNEQADKVIALLERIADGLDRDRRQAYGYKASSVASQFTVEQDADRAQERADAEVLASASESAKRQAVLDSHLGDNSTSEVERMRRADPDASQAMAAVTRAAKKAPRRGR